MSNGQDIDYEAIEIPDGDDPQEYHYTTRRAEILQAVKSRGNPYSFNRRQLADRYDVHPSNITRDFQRLAEYIEANIGEDAKVTARTAMEKAVVNAQNEGEYAKAFYIAMEWNRWLQSIGEQERAPSKIDATVREAAMEGDEYTLITDDDEIQADPLEGEAMADE